jgi:hypothetical protein
MLTFLFKKVVMIAISSYRTLTHMILHTQLEVTAARIAASAGKE